MQTVTMPLPLAGKNGISCVAPPRKAEGYFFYGTAQQLGERIGRHVTMELCNIVEYRRTKFDILFNMTGMLCSTIYKNWDLNLHRTTIFIKMIAQKNNSCYNHLR